MTNITRGTVTTLEITNPSNGVVFASIIHLKSDSDGLKSNTTTKDRWMIGPATILRKWYDDGGCLTVEFDYAPDVTYAELTHEAEHLSSN